MLIPMGPSTLCQVLFYCSSRGKYCPAPCLHLCTWSWNRCFRLEVSRGSPWPTAHHLRPGLFFSVLSAPCPWALFFYQPALPGATLLWCSPNLSSCLESQFSAALYTMPEPYPATAGAQGGGVPSPPLWRDSHTWNSCPDGKQPGKGFCPHP